MGAGFTMSPSGPFELARQRDHFGGWPAYAPDPDALAMTFPVEGWVSSATVVLRQPHGGTVTGEVFGATGAEAKRAWNQALAVLSLDVDGAGFPAVGERDAVMADLLERHRALRPVLFHSPYEAACNFVIGQRISIVQGRALRARLAEESGDRIDAGGAHMAAFPRPPALLELSEIRSLPAEKVHRLHAVAQAALDGRLDRARLRRLAVPKAIAELEAIHGVGPFSAQGILFRGAGLSDEITDDPVTKEAVQRRYELDHLPGQEQVLAIAEAWRPYRMWCLVLLHVWIREEGGGPSRASRRH